MAELAGVLRTILAAGFGFLASKGYFDAETGIALSGAVGTILVAAWSIWQKRSAAAAAGGNNQ